MNNNTTDNFWNDDLVKEYTHDVIIKALNERTVSPLTWDEQILKFKQSKLQQPKEEPKRFEVAKLDAYYIDRTGNTYPTQHCEYKFITNHLIPEEKYEAVKKAISDCLNEDHPKEKLDNPFFGMGYSFFNHPNSISITKEQLDAMMENVWNAARDVESFLTDAKYPTFKDYQQSLPENKQPVEDKSLFNADKINDRIKQLEEMEDAFNAAREFNVGTAQNTFYDIASELKYKSFLQYSKEKSETQTTSNASIKCQNEEIVKPPLGLMSEFIWLEKRMDDIQDAMERYSKFGKPIPIKWNNELIEVCKKMLTKKIKQ